MPIADAIAAVIRSLEKSGFKVFIAHCWIPANQQER
jgi:hypothetical protein